MSGTLTGVARDPTVLAAHELCKEVGGTARDAAMAMRYLVPGWTYDPKQPSLGRRAR